MLRKLKQLFIFLAVLSALVWVVGLLTSIIVPVFGGIPADKIGAALFFASLLAEVLMHLFGWLAQRGFFNRGNRPHGFSVEKKYGNKQ